LREFAKTLKPRAKALPKPAGRKPPANADEIEAAVAEAQTQLAEAGSSGVLARDPYRLALAGLSVTIGVLPKVVRRIEGALSGVVVELGGLVAAVRHPLTQAEREALRRDILETTRASVSGAAADVARLARARDRRSLAVAFAGGMAALAITGGGAYWTGRISARAEAAAQVRAERADVAFAQEHVTVPLETARLWLRLIRANEDPAAAIAQAKQVGAEKDGRRFAAVPLWLDPQTVPGGARH
jgi:hypothetical protein